jgi:DNA repair protein RecO (recombination protein O)
MLAKTKAIVLKNTNYSESSVISKMYTREFGLRTYMINGVRKGKSAIRPSMIQPLSLVQLDVYEKPNASINRIKELKNIPILHNIHADMLKKTIALFLIEILNYSLEEELCELELFDFVEGEILNLENEEVIATFPIEFLLSFSHFLGFQPQGRFSDSTPYFNLHEGIFVPLQDERCTDLNISKAISGLLSQSNEPKGMLPAKTRRECLNAVLMYYQTHIARSKQIKSVDILTELLN